MSAPQAAERIREAMEAGNYRMAMEGLDTALAREPNNPTLLLLRGECHLALGHTAEAAEVAKFIRGHIHPSLADPLTRRVRNRLARRGAGMLAALFLGFAALFLSAMAGWFTADQMRPRTQAAAAPAKLKLPGEPTEARIMFRPWGSMDPASWESGPWASGAIRIPAGTEVHLELPIAEISLLSHVPRNALQGVSITGAGQLSRLNGLARQRGLFRLEVRDAHVTHGALASLPPLPLLREAVLDASALGPGDFAWLGALPQLTVLRLRGGAVDDSALQALEQAKKLRVLELEEVNASGTGFSSWSVEPSSLKWLRIAPFATNEGVLAISRIASLRYLDLGDNQAITTDGAHWIANLKNLEVLDLSNTGIRGGVVEALAALPSIERISLGNTSLWGARLNALAQAPELDYLDVRGAPLNRDELAAFIRLKPACEVLHPLAMLARERPAPGGGAS